MTSANRRPTRPMHAVLALVTMAVVLLGLDLVWLGVAAHDFYAVHLGALRSPDVVWPAALLFYAFYLGFVLLAAVLPTRSLREAGLRGAALELLAYGTYELTNWAVIAGWPAALVPVDILWGVALTATVAAAGRFVLERAAAVTRQTP